MKQEFAHRAEHKESREIFRFKKEGGQWFILKDEFLSCGWSLKDMELTDGTRKLLNGIAMERSCLALSMGLHPVDDSICLRLRHHCSNPAGGGIYTVLNDEARQYWICDLALFVFGDIPDEFFIRPMPWKAFHSGVGEQRKAAIVTHGPGNWQG